MDIEARRRRQREYYARRKAADPEGLRAALRKSSKKYRAKNPERAKAWQRKWRKANPGYGAMWRKGNEKYQQQCRENKHGCAQRYPAPEYCECCGIRMADTPRGPQFDHDHARSFHRGWLCNACNNGLARLGDCITGLRHALAYLEKAEAAWQMSRRK